MDSLQFEKAEFSDPRPKCGACKRVIDGPYFQLAGAAICPACAEIVRGLQSNPSPSVLLRSLAYGAGAAVVCAVVYGVIIMVTGIELALVSIAVGYLVGRAVRIGAGGKGNRICQIIAVVLTYLAISLSYIVLVFRQPDVSAFSLIATAIGLVVNHIPFQIRDGISGILSILILGFGMMQAWKQTRPDARVLSGPFTLDVGASVG